VDWSPDGQTIAFDRLGDDGKWDLWLMDVNSDNHVSGWIFWPWKRVPEADATRWRGLMDIPSTPAWDLVRMDVAFAIAPPNPAVVTAAQQGMDEFLESMKAEALVVDQEMAGVLTAFNR
jgi:hypothetical protein